MTGGTSTCHTPYLKSFRALISTQTCASIITGTGLERPTVTHFPPAAKVPQASLTAQESRADWASPFSASII